MGQFVAIRMIVVKPNESKTFETWMTGTFLNAMGKLFKPDGQLYQHYSKTQGNPLDGVSGLQQIIFLKGNKQNAAVSPYPLQSHQHAAARAGSSEAGANADYAWIAFWTNRAANRAAWSCEWRPDTWCNATATAGHWRDFRDKCFSRVPPGGGAASTPARPPHGSPYDYLGSGSQRGAGAGCLVEGFEVIPYEPDWS